VYFVGSFYVGISHCTFQKNVKFSFFYRNHGAIGNMVISEVSQKWYFRCQRMCR